MNIFTFLLKYYQFVYYYNNALLKYFSRYLDNTKISALNISTVAQTAFLGNMHLLCIANKKFCYVNLCKNNNII